MIDLTPLDVRKKRGDFRRILRGYDPEEVDTFLSLVTERFEELVRENLTLTERTQRLERQVGAMEGREKAIQDALVSAQKLREEVNHQSRRDAETLKEQASRSAALMKAEAESEIARRMMEAEGVMRERQRALEELERSRLKFLKSFRGLLERELDSVEVEEARKPLEEIPLELEFRGWVPSGKWVVEPETGTGELVQQDDASEEEPGEVEASEDPGEVGESDPVVDVSELAPADDSLEPEAHGGSPDPELIEEAVTVEPELVSGTSELPDAGAMEADTQVMEIPTDAPGLDGGGSQWWGREGLKELVEEVVNGAGGVVDAEEAAESPDSAHESAGSQESGALTQEPKWLFSLLKREEDEGVEG